jgi:hypothetical protein
MEKVKRQGSSKILDGRETEKFKEKELVIKGEK